MSHISPRKIKDFSPNSWRGNFLYTDFLYILFSNCPFTENLFTRELVKACILRDVLSLINREKTVTKTK